MIKGGLTIANHPLWHLTMGRLRELFREPGILFWVFGFPILMAVGLGLAFRESEPPKPQVAVVDGTPWLTDALNDEALVVTSGSKAETREMLKSGKVDLVVAPADGPRAVTFLFDPKNANGRLAKLITDDVLQNALGRKDIAAVQTETVEERGARYIDFLIPGLIGMNIMSSSLWGLAYALVLSRKRRLLKRMAATPMRRTHYLLAFMLSRLLLLTLEVGLLLLFGALIFDLTIHGSLVGVGLVAMGTAVSFSGIGFLIGARLENTEVASGWMNLVMLPMWILSGTFFSYERFPEFLHPAIEALPLTAANNAFRAVINDGAGLIDIGVPLAIMAAWGLGGFLIASRRFRWQ